MDSLFPKIWAVEAVGIGAISKLFRMPYLKKKRSLGADLGLPARKAATLSHRSKCSCCEQHHTHIRLICWLSNLIPQGCNSTVWVIQLAPLLNAWFLNRISSFYRWQFSSCHDLCHLGIMHLTLSRPRKHSKGYWRYSAGIGVYSFNPPSFLSTQVITVLGPFGKQRCESGQNQTSIHDSPLP